MKNTKDHAGKGPAARRRHPVPAMHAMRRSSTERYLAYRQRLEDIRKI